MLIEEVATEEGVLADVDGGGRKGDVVESSAKEESCILLNDCDARGDPDRDERRAATKDVLFDPRHARRK